MKYLDDSDFNNNGFNHEAKSKRTSGTYYVFNLKQLLVAGRQLQYFENLDSIFEADSKYHEAKNFLSKNYFNDIDPVAIKYVQTLLEMSDVSCTKSGLRTREQFKEFAEYLFYKSLYY